MGRLHPCPLGRSSLSPGAAGPRSLIGCLPFCWRAWTGGFLLLHIATNVQVWDRYLLPLVMPMALLGGWAAAEMAHAYQTFSPHARAGCGAPPPRHGAAAMADDSDPSRRPVALDRPRFPCGARRSSHRGRPRRVRRPGRSAGGSRHPAHVAVSSRAWLARTLCLCLIRFVMGTSNCATFPAPCTWLTAQPNRRTSSVLSSSPTGRRCLTCSCSWPYARLQAQLVPAHRPLYGLSDRRVTHP